MSSSEGLGNLGETCYLNAAVQAIRPILDTCLIGRPGLIGVSSTLSKSFETRDVRWFVEAAEEAIGRSLNRTSDSAEFLSEILAVLAAETPAVSEAIGIRFTDTSSCGVCGTKLKDDEVRMERVVTVRTSEGSEVTAAEALALATAADDGPSIRCGSCGAEARSKSTRSITSLGESVVIAFADPRVVTLVPEEHVELLPGQRYALVGLIGFRDSHYTALSKRSLGWVLLDDSYSGHHALETYLSWIPLITTAVFAREKEVTLTFSSFCPRATSPSSSSAAPAASTAQQSPPPLPSVVQVAGSFNSWQPVAAELDGGGGKWKASIRAPKGVHHFKLVVDGSWVVDESIPTALDPHGNVNNLLIID